MMRSYLIFFFIIILPHPKSTLFPYTTLFRSNTVLSMYSKNKIKFFVGLFLFALILNIEANYSDGDLRSRPALFVVIHRSEEHTSERQSRPHLVCRLLLETKKQKV